MSTDERVVVAPAGAKPAVLQPYRQFVAADSDSIDLIDHVAYSLYKRDKLGFLTAFAQTHGREPTDAELHAFVSGSMLQTRIDSFRNEATELLRSFSEVVLSEAEKEVEERYRLKFDEELRKVRPFWRTLWDNILANIGALAITALVLLVIYGSKIGAATLIGEVFNYDVKDRSAQQSTPSHTAAKGPASSQ